jgi:pimeloyl-ACP methyl ester carboxylesterase
MACLGLLFAATAMASPAAPAKMPDSYAKPGRQVAIGQGRHLNLRCSGSGPVTVLLESGSHADSTSWFRVQPLLAAQARVCSYDRAGYGFSDEGPLPRGLDADVADLHALIEAAHLHTPLVLVGHSLGSNIVRRYAGAHPGDVAGMVLVDPPAQDLARFLPAAWMKDDAAMTAQRDAFIGHCEQAAEHGGLAKPSPALAPWRPPIMRASCTRRSGTPCVRNWRRTCTCSRNRCRQANRTATCRWWC